MAKLLIVNN